MMFADGLGIIAALEVNIFGWCFQLSPCLIRPQFSSSIKFRRRTPDVKAGIFTLSFR